MTSPIHTEEKKIPEIDLMASLTEEDIQKMPIEKIIHLPNFHSLTSGGGIENARQFEPVTNPYWKIEFKAYKEIGTGKYIAFGKHIPFPIYVIHKFKS